MRNFILLFTLSLFSSVFSQKKLTIADSLILGNGSVLKIGSVLKVATPVEPAQYHTVFLGTFNKSMVAKFNLGMTPYMPLAYRNTQFVVTELLLFTIQGKQSQIVNFADGPLKGFTFIDRSSINGEVEIK